MYNYHYEQTPVFRVAEPGFCTTMGRIPYLSILGILLLAGGCTLLMLGYKTFAPGFYDTYQAVGFNKTLADVYCKDCAEFIDDEAEKGKDSYYSPENPNYIIVDSVLAAAAIVFLLIIAILSTGYTREVCCQARSCCQGYAMFLHFTTGLFVLIFFVLFLAMGIVFLFPMLFTFYIDSKCETNQKTKPCFDMADFGLSPKNGENFTQVCFGDDGLCGRMDDLQLGFIYMCSGGFAAALGLVFVLMANAANFAHFRDMKKVESEEKYVF